MRPVRVTSVMAGLLAVIAVAAATPAVAATPIGIRATINGQSLSSASANHPVRLDPKKPATVTLTVHDRSAQPITVSRVELSGRVVGLTFFAFDTSVSLAVPAGASATLTYSLDLTGLGGQATGLIGGSVSVFDGHGHRVGREGMVSDVRGSLISVYGLFGLALLVLTVLALLDTALAIARHRMPANRWRRALRFLTPGVGIGLVIVFTLSAVRIWVPTPGKWLWFAIGSAVVFFVIGYFAPTPDDDEDEDEEDEGEPIYGSASSVPAGSVPAGVRSTAALSATTPVPPPPADTESWAPPPGTFAAGPAPEDTQSWPPPPGTFAAGPPPADTQSWPPPPDAYANEPPPDAFAGGPPPPAPPTNPWDQQ